MKTSVLPFIVSLFFAQLASAKMNHRDVMCAMSQGFKFTSDVAELKSRLDANETIANDPQVCPDPSQSRALIVQFTGGNHPFIVLRGDADVDAGIELLVNSGKVNKQ